MDDLLSVLVTLIVLVPAMALVVRLPDHLHALFAPRQDDAWPRGVQEDDSVAFRWNGATPAPASPPLSPARPRVRVRRG